jgi:ATP-dependent Lhr-like helicase
MVSQSLRDCLEEAMDLPQLTRIVDDVLAGRIECFARDTPEPSPLCHELLNARPYAFLDDAPLEERRTQAVYSRRTLEPSSAAELGALDRAAIDRVREEAWPEADSPDELHDALLMCGFLLDHEAERGGARWARFFDELCAAGRATLVTSAVGRSFWTTVERQRELFAVLDDATASPVLDPPPGHDAQWSREDAMRELVKSRYSTVQLREG